MFGLLKLVNVGKLVIYETQKKKQLLMMFSKTRFEI